MSHDNKPIRDFTDIVAWRKSHALAVEIYKITTDFPKEEQFGLTNQIRRAAVSVSSNIAEGFGRRTINDRVRFYDMARASLHEIQAQLLIAKDVGFMTEAAYTTIDSSSVECHKLLTGLINKTKSLDS